MTSARAAEAAPGELTPEATADFRWFDTLGFPDVKGSTFAHVATGGWSVMSQQPVKEMFIDGFLLRHGEDGKFRVLTPELLTEDYQSRPATADRHRVGYEARPLAEAADAEIAAVDGFSGDHGQVVRRRFGQRLSERGQIFGWAFAATLPEGSAGRGRVEALGRSLADVVVAVDAGAAALPDPEERRAVEARLAAEFAGNPLTASAMVGWVVEVTGNLPRGVEGVRVAASRDEGLDGVRLAVTWLTAKVQTTAAGLMASEELVTVGNDCTYRSQGGWEKQHATEPETFRDFEGKVKEVLGSEADRAFGVEVSLGEGGR